MSSGAGATQHCLDLRIPPSLSESDEIGEFSGMMNLVKTYDVSLRSESNRRNVLDPRSKTVDVPAVAIDSTYQEHLISRRQTSILEYYRVQFMPITSGE